MTRPVPHRSDHAVPHSADAPEISYVHSDEFPQFDRDPTVLERALAWHESLERPATPPDRTRLPAHLEVLCSSPLLSPQEERQLFLQMNYLKYRAEKISESSTADGTAERVEQLLAVAQQIRNHIVQANTRLVMSIIKHFANEFNSFDDLLSEGISCLIKAVGKFDYARGFRFSTYATMAIRREVYRLLKRSHRERGRFATGTGDVLGALEARETPANRSEQALSIIDHGVSEMLTQLDDREQLIVKARYGFIDLGTKPTFSKLGERLGISKERVRQLEIRAVGKLRDRIGDLGIAELFSPA